MFGDAKTRGLNLEDTRLTDPRKLALLMALVALAIAWAGRAAADLLGPRFPKRKSHGHFAQSWFRIGFDEVRNRSESNPAAAITEWLRLAAKPPKNRESSCSVNSDHDGPIFPFIAEGYEVHGPDQLWVADITYIAIAAGFVYLAVVLDAWSRRVIGYALGRRIDARLTVAALERAIALRRPLPGCLFHSDRGSQYASEKHRALLAAHGLVGSMSRRGNPYDNPEGRELHQDAQGRGGLPRRLCDLRGRRRQPAPLHRGGLQRQTPALRPGLPEPQPVRGSIRPRPGKNRRLKLSNERGALQRTG